MSSEKEPTPCAGCGAKAETKTCQTCTAAFCGERMEIKCEGCAALICDECAYECPLCNKGVAWCVGCFTSHAHCRGSRKEAFDKMVDNLASAISASTEQAMRKVVDRIVLAINALEVRVQDLEKQKKT